jgi:hypothetical protein
MENQNPHSYSGTKNGVFGYHRFEGVDTYSCGHTKWTASHNSGKISRPCHDCMVAMIGTRKTVVRYGELPANGKSYNFADNKQEMGVSCYFDGQIPRPEFTSRKKIIFTAVVVGIGSDDEPLIDTDSIELI